MSFVFIFLLGLCLGSFLNAWILRMRSGKSIIRGRSSCPACHHTLGFFDLIPLISFIFLRGKCRYCKKNISWNYLLLELVTGILFALVFSQHSLAFVPVELTRDLAIVFFLEFIFFYDLWYGEIPDRAGLLPGIFLLIFSLIFDWQTPKSIFLGLLIGTGFFLIQYLISKGKWIGAGDIRLGFFMGVILGYPLILVALFLAYVGGSLALLPFLLLKKINKQSKIPFGAILVPATLITFFWGQPILKWWLSLL